MNRVEIRIESTNSKWTVGVVQEGVIIFDATCYEYSTVLMLLEAIKDKWPNRKEW